MPLGEESQHWLQRYLDNARGVLAAGKAVPAGADGEVPMFIDAGRKPLTRQYFWALVKRYAQRWPESTRPWSARTACATASPPTCSTAAPTRARCRCCSGTARCRRPRSTPWWHANTCRSCTSGIIRAGERRRRVCGHGRLQIACARIRANPLSGSADGSLRPFRAAVRAASLSACAQPLPPARPRLPPSPPPRPPPAGDRPASRAALAQLDPDFKPDYIGAAPSPAFREAIVGGQGAVRQR